jgi:hypothetical protein
MIRVRGAGPVFWGVEHDPSDRRVLISSWMVEDQPPWRESIWAFRARLGNAAIHMGLCRRRDTALHKDLEVDPHEIGQWRKRAQAQAGGDTASDEVRQVQ